MKGLMDVRPVVMAVVGVLLSAGAAKAATPGWATPLAGDIQPPSELSADGQEACESRILSSLNHQFNTKFTAADIAPVQAPSWAHPERGFIRGGGYNIRIVAANLRTDDLEKLRSGRFEGEKNGHADSLVASLHVPGTVHGVQTFNETSDVAGEVSVDFTAHIDSAYAYTPWGLIAHFFKDIAGADRRNPCPTVGAAE